MTKHLFFLCVWCVLHGDGFLMVFAASLNLMICTATICNSFGDVLGFHGVPIVLDQPRFLRFGRLPPSETKPESVVILRSFWGKGHLTIH